MRINGDIEVVDETLAEFCRRWRIAEFSLFGSVLGDDFGPESDVDVLVQFEQPVSWTVFDIGRMEDELAAMIGRKVDLVERQAVEESKNYIRRRAILGSARRVYAAR